MTGPSLFRASGLMGDSFLSAEFPGEADTVPPMLLELGWRPRPFGVFAVLALSHANSPCGDCECSGSMSPSTSADHEKPSGVAAVCGTCGGGCCCAPWSAWNAGSYHWGIRPAVLSGLVISWSKPGIVPGRNVSCGDCIMLGSGTLPIISVPGGGWFGDGVCTDPPA
jgi:hypothetical protein